jgi:CTP:molybdopterin cytidylyltransferase MocA
MSSLALVVLAAGESRRLGTCKALVELRGRKPATPLGLLLEAGSFLSPPPPMVVGGADHALIGRALPAAVELEHNPRWREGRSGGLALAVRRRPDQDLCVAPVDVPLVSMETFQGLAERWRAAGEPPWGWLAPCVPASGSRRFGHPIVLGRELARSLLTWPRERPLRDLRGLADPLLALEVEDEAILDDLDTPRDLARLRERLAGAD